LVRPSTLTAVTTSLASDIADPFCLRSARCPETRRNYVVKPDTPPPTRHEIPAWGTLKGGYRTIRTPTAKTSA
jgi:hypothetical protein